MGGGLGLFDSGSCFQLSTPRAAAAANAATPGGLVTHLALVVAYDMNAKAKEQ